MSEFVTAASNTVFLVVVAWIVVMGSVGAALGQTRAGRPTMGFFVSVFTPVPLLGWVIVVGLSHRTEKVRSGEPEASFFENLND